MTEHRKELNADSWTYRLNVEWLNLERLNVKWSRVASSYKLNERKFNLGIGLNAQPQGGRRDRELLTHFHREHSTHSHRPSERPQVLRTFLHLIAITHGGAPQYPLSAGDALHAFWSSPLHWSSWWSDQHPPLPERKENLRSLSCLWEE